jgi:deleted in liver cancer protein
LIRYKILSGTFAAVPSELHLEAVQSVMLLLSDVNRQVLHVLLRFLAAVADRSEENQMNASNLAVCFLPSFFRTHPSTSFVGELKSGNQTDHVGAISPAWDHKVAVACITFLINNSRSIFQIPEFSWTMLQSSISALETSSNFGAGVDFRSIDIPSFVQIAHDTCHLKDSEWICQASWFEQTKLSWRLINDNLLLPMWRCTTEIEAPPGEVLSRLKGEQHLWDCSLIKGRIAERLNERTDVVHYVLHIDSHEAPREFCELRTWKADRARGSYILAKTSVIHPNVPRTETLRAITFASHYLIEPCGAGRSRVTHISRVDIRGHLIDWYHNVYGRLLERHLHKLNKAFTPVTVNAAGPETKL